MASLDLRQSTIFSRLRGLLEVTRLVRTGEELNALLASVARTASDSLAFRTVVINLYRREWNDFIVTTVYGSSNERATALIPYLDRYNYRRPHGSLSHQPPASRLNNVLGNYN